MKDIIIVGISKGGKLHLQSYNKIKKKGRIFLVDHQKGLEEENMKIYETITDVVHENNLEVENIVVDICTPKSVFNQMIEECLNLHIKNILVEKPFVVDNDFFEQNKQLKIAMVQNYLYSKITADIKKYIETNHLKIESIYTNFSKNRISDSIKGRGIARESVTENLEIEIPHQIYMANYFASNYHSHKVLLLEQKDMKEKNVTLKNHGYGKIIAKKDDILVIHESDLTTDTTIREVIIVCDNNIVIKGEYFIYDKQFHVLKKGRLEVLQLEKELLTKEYEEDDNMFECILDAYSYFNQKHINEEYQERILNFSKEMKQYQKQ